MQHLISPFADATKTLAQISANPRLQELTYEFCTKFFVKAHHHGGLPNNQILLVTDSGLPAGKLSVSKDSEGDYYIYTAPFISKSRSSTRTGRDSRDASKIKDLLRVVINNGEQPSDAKLYESYSGGLNYAFRQTKRHSAPSIHVSSDLTIAMIEGILKINEQNLTNRMQDVNNLYTEYTDKLKTMRDERATHNRFISGSTVIGIHKNMTSDMGKPFYLVGEATWDSGADRTKITKNLVRHASLSEVPELVSDIAIIRTYFETHKQGANLDGNELGVAMQDQYFYDIDISVGYVDRQVFWVLIPKTAP